MSRDQDEFDTPEIPSTEKGPRSPADQEYTGVGTPRSADEGPAEAGTTGDRTDTTDLDPAVTVGATTSSHPADADEVDINRSGSGGSGGATTNDAGVEGSSPATMDEMLGGDPGGGPER